MITEMDKVDFILKEGLRKGMSTSKFIKKQIDEFKESTKYKEMLIGNKYYKNKGEIANKKRTYIDENGNEKVAPHAKNYTLKHPIVYKMINQKAGYLMRKKPTIKQHLEENEEKDKDYEKLIDDLFNNKMHKRLKYTLIESVKRSIAWWQIYIDEEGKLKVKLRYGTNVVPLWKDEEHESLDGLIYFYEVEDYTSEETKEIKTKVEYYDENGIRYYIYDGDSLIEDVVETEKRKDFFIIKDDEGISIFGHYKVNTTVTLWKRIPWIYFKYNGDELPLIHFLKEMVDCYDELCSKYGDSIYEAPDGVNVVKNYQAEAGTFQKNLQTFNTVFLDIDGDYDRKSVEINTTGFKDFITQLRKDIYEGGFGVDTQSEKFGTQDSGVAIKQLYSDLDLDCSNIEVEFKSSLEYFKPFIDEWAATQDGHDYSERKLEYIFNKTMTVNEKELIENCNNSMDVISQKSLLAHHPYVDNVEDELKELAKEKKEKEKEAEKDYTEIFKEINKNNSNPKINNKAGADNE